MEIIQRDMQDLTSSQRRMNHFAALAGAAIIFFSGVAFTVLLYIGGDRVNIGDLGGASLALVILAVLAAFEAIHPLPKAYQYLGQSREAGGRLTELVAVGPEVRFPEQTLAIPRSFDVAVENIDFRYPNRTSWTLRSVDFYIPAG
jgi:ATP-binding cassette subfamily C protein CydC